jgi:5'-methylthioadenosine phosphorylase
MITLGIIGGSGLEKMDVFKNPEEIVVDTPFGETSSPLLSGVIMNSPVIFLSRHGADHTITPTHVNNKANIFALKKAGCTHIITTTACGSLNNEIQRGDLLIPDQFIDFTRHRATTFFNEFSPGTMKHTPMADPFNKNLRNLLIETATDLNLKIHKKGTIITIEGPRFSTRAESRMFRLWGADIINMSIAPEAILANELAIPYATIAMSTDYDSWKEDEESVTWEDVIKVFNNNVHNVIKLLLAVIPKIR